MLSGFVVHRSGTKTKYPGQARFAVGARFNNADEETFIQRGYPSLHRMSIVPELNTEEVPSTEVIKKVFKI